MNVTTIACCALNRNAYSIAVTSPTLDVNGSLAQDLAQELVLRVTRERIAAVDFIYKPNPVITDVFPLHTIRA